MTRRIVNHTKTPEKIDNYSVDRYTSTAYMEAEWANVWRRSWLLAGLASDVNNPGDYFVFDMDREQILVTKTEQGEVQGFYNVCQHRGNTLVSHQRGHANSFRCAYHAWTYELNGRLKSVHYEERFEQGVDCEARSLKAVRTEIWDGFVFVCLADDAPPLLDFLGPLVEQLAPFKFANMTLVEDQTVTHRCNWKAVVDNFSELYHVDFLHPQHKRMVDCCNDTVHLFENGHTGLEVPGATVNPRFPVPDMPTDIQTAQLQSLGLNPKDFQGKVLEVREAVQNAKRGVGLSKGIDYQAFSDDQLSDVWQFNLFPNIILSFTPEHCWVMRARPDARDPQKCKFDKLTLLPFAQTDQGPQAGQAQAGEAEEIVGPGRTSELGSTRLDADYVRPEHDEFDHLAIISGEKTMTDTIDQDIELLGGVQKGMGSAGFDSVWLNDDEMRVQHFHNELDRLIN